MWPKRLACDFSIKEPRRPRHCHRPIGGDPCVFSSATTSISNRAAKTRFLPPKVQLLRDFGHEISTFEMDNDAVETMSRPELIQATIWNGKSRRAIANRVASDRVDVVHFHNTFPLILPRGLCRSCCGPKARRSSRRCTTTACSARAPTTSFAIRSGLRGLRREKCSVARRPAQVLSRKSHRQCWSLRPLIATHHALGTWQNAVDVYLA